MADNESSPAADPGAADSQQTAEPTANGAPSAPATTDSAADATNDIESDALDQQQASDEPAGDANAEIAANQDNPTAELESRQPEATDPARIDSEPPADANANASLPPSESAPPTNDSIAIESHEQVTEDPNPVSSEPAYASSDAPDTAEAHEERDVSTTDASQPVTSTVAASESDVSAAITSSARESRITHDEHEDFDEDDEDHPDSRFDDLRTSDAQPAGTTATTFAPVPGTSSSKNATIIRSNLHEWFNKVYLGGYRNRKSGLEYFHAETQTTTPQEIRARAAGERFHRDTQTKFWRNRRNQTSKETSTQMTRTGCYVSVETDKIKDPRPYVTADEFHELQVQKAVVIQCFIRQTFARRLAQKLRHERDRRIKAMAEKDRRRIMLSEKKRLKDIESRLHPKTTKDFEVLYTGLENWRVQETERINAMGYSEPARLAALADLLDQESALLQKIDRLKIAANEENREKAVVRLLESMSSPKRWPTAVDDAVVLVDTPSTIRARELRDLYHALNLPLLSVDERLQILLHVKYTVKEFDCNLTREIVELIDREGDLVSRGRNASSLEGLRRRISNLFLQFIRTPEFNPEASNHQAFPHAGQAWKRDAAVYYCRGCTKYKPSTEFYLSTTMKHLGKCKDCTMKENLATERADDAAYGDMLKLVRVQEAIKRKSSGAPADAAYNAMALLQESDMRYLVDVIWNRKSAIGGSRNMEELILTRWDGSVELSPWNCILLTKAEAATHDRRPDPHELYSPEFVNKVLQKHMLARQHFGQLPVMAKYLKHHYVEDRDGKLVPRTEDLKAVAV